MRVCLCMTVGRSVGRSVCISVCRSVCLSVCLSVCRFVCQSVGLSVCLPLSLCLSLCLFVSFSFCLSLRLSTSLSVCFSLRPPCLFPSILTRVPWRLAVRSPQADAEPRNCLETLALDIFRAHTGGARFNRATSGAEWWSQVGLHRCLHTRRSLSDARALVVCSSEAVTVLTF